jgi:riboflavin synthase
MFTGIVEELGTIVTREAAERDGARVRIRATEVLDDAHVGDSIAVNGCCLTVVEFQRDGDGPIHR